MSVKPDSVRPAPAAPAGAPARESLPHVCRLLRTKTAYGTSERGAEWKRGDSPTAVYWCLGTMEAFGVDEGYCHPHACVKGRGCWEAAGEDDEE